MRYLFFVALGGAISLYLLSNTSANSIFEPWANGFMTAAVFLMIGWAYFGSRKIVRADERAKRDAVDRGDIQAALVIKRTDRRSTDDDKLEDRVTITLHLLVDRKDAEPFRTIFTTSRPASTKTAPQRGDVIAVRQPYPGHSIVEMVDAEPPPSHHELTHEIAATAERLPQYQPKVPWGKISVHSLASLLTLSVGFFGAPFLVTSKAPEYVPYIFSANNAAIDRIENPNLFEAQALQQSNRALETELGHNEVFMVQVFELYLAAEAPETAGSNIERQIHVRNHSTAWSDVEEEPTEQHRQRFLLSDIDGDTVIAAIPIGKKFLESRGHLNPTTSEIQVLHDMSPQQQVYFRIYYTTAHGKERVSFTLDGEIQHR